MTRRQVLPSTAQRVRDPGTVHPLLSPAVGKRGSREGWRACEEGDTVASPRERSIGHGSAAFVWADEMSYAAHLMEDVVFEQLEHVPLPSLECDNCAN